MKLTVKKIFNKMRHYVQTSGVRRELRRVALVPRYTAGITTVFGHPFAYVDSASFLSTYAEIFDQGIYAFSTASDMPYILDCGANIGLSVLFFKQCCPNSRIVAFEPDPEICRVLETNIANFNLTNMRAVEKAVWSSETTLEFLVEGADGGRVINIDENFPRRTVKTVRLRDYLVEHVDLLKIDIEGAESEVLVDIADRLDCVERIFVEYHSFADRAQSLSSIVAILSDAGFRLHFHPCSIAPHPFVEIPSHFGMDMQLNIFGTRPARMR